MGEDMSPLRLDQYWPLKDLRARLAESQKRVANTLAREVSETGILCRPLFSKVGRPHRGRRAAAGRAR